MNEREKEPAQKKERHRGDSAWLSLARLLTLRQQHSVLIETPLARYVREERKTGSAAR
jgi:hypothetical protein